jgi:anti-sigma factor RsiW
LFRWVVEGGKCKFKTRQSKTMPMTEKDRPEEPRAVKSSVSLLLQDERLAAMASAYLDKELKGQELEEFEALMRENEALAREVADLQRIEGQLSKMGADILLEPIPEALLEGLSRLKREKE